MKEKPLNILGVRIDNISVLEATAKIKQWILAYAGSRSNYICVTNVNSVVEAQKDGLLKTATNQSDISVCDGMPLIWIGKAKGVRLKERICGIDLMNAFFKDAEANGYSSYFYGSTEQVLNKLLANIKTNYPKIKIAGAYSPPFRSLTETENQQIIDDISGSGADVVWVGLGYPKQELWMYQNRDHIKCPVLAGVGAAFDFISGNKKRAPVWMQKNGLEWLFRLLCEPQRLWKRYLINNSLFIFFMTRELLSPKDKPKNNLSK